MTKDYAIGLLIGALEGAILALKYNKPSLAEKLREIVDRVQTELNLSGQ